MFLSKKFLRVVRNNLAECRAMYDNGIGSPELEYKLYEALVDEMPYGTAKGRTGDPGEFIYERIAAYFEDDHSAADFQRKVNRG